MVDFEAASSKSLKDYEMKSERCIKMGSFLSIKKYTPRNTATSRLMCQDAKLHIRNDKTAVDILILTLRDKVRHNPDCEMLRVRLNLQPKDWCVLLDIVTTRLSLTLCYLVLSLLFDRVRMFALTCSVCHVLCWRSAWGSRCDAFSIPSYTLPRLFQFVIFLLNLRLVNTTS